MSKNYRQGVRKAGAMVALTAATPANAYLLSAGRTAVIRKLQCYNGAGANGILQIGTGLAPAFVQAMPSIAIINGMDLEIREEDLPELEFTATITVQSSVGAANVQILLEVEEFQGPTG